MPSTLKAAMTSEIQLKKELLDKLRNLKYEVRTHIRGRATLERNFREHFQALNRVKLTDGFDLHGGYAVD